MNVVQLGQEEHAGRLDPQALLVLLVLKASVGQMGPSVPLVLPGLLARPDLLAPRTCWPTGTCWLTGAHNSPCDPTVGIVSGIILLRLTWGLT